MLDMLIKKRGNALHYSPFKKDSAKHIPLGSDSRHSPNIHLNWPVCEIQRMFVRSCHEHDFQSFKQRKINRFVHCLLHSVVIEKCRQWTPSVSTRSRILEKACNTESDGRKPINNNFYLVFPYCEHGAQELAEAISQINRQWAPYLRFNLKHDINFQISWASAGKPLFSKLTGICPASGQSD